MDGLSSDRDYRRKMKYKKAVKEIVEKLLIKDTRCRNNDKWLIICVLKKFGVELSLTYEDMKNIPAFESISKCRRSFQNTKNKYNVEEFIPEEGVKYESPASQ